MKTHRDDAGDLVGRGGTMLLGMLVLAGAAAALAAGPGRRPVPREHPRLLGSQKELQALAGQRKEAYQRVVGIARGGQADDHSRMMSLALVSAIEGDKDLGEQAKRLAMKYVNGPIRKGHVTFGHDLALSAIGYDLCFPSWTEAERTKFHDYLNQTVDANVQSETAVFHNGWYGYKNWGIGLACYACYHENPRAPAILKALEQEYRDRAAPALELAGDGGGFGEGYYVNYWLYEWLFFCEAARRCEGLDYYAMAPKFFRNRAVAGMFETYPGIDDYRSRRPIPMGDGGGRAFGGDRDKALSARRILVNHYRDDPAHQAVHTFNETTPRSSVGTYAYKDFLWRDATIPQGDLKSFRLSHLSPGPGYVCARSSWDEDATYFFFKCGDRFTAHQHLDVGHFLIYQRAELAGDGGHYDDFGTSHDVNYHLRTVAHSTILVYDPAEESWKRVRAGPVSANDGGQMHAWPHHNGSVLDADQWHKQQKVHDIADLAAFEDRGRYLYVAGNATRAYSPEKLDYFTRQIVYLRPDTFVIFDRVRSKQAGFKKTWLLQAMEIPASEPPHLVITNAQGRLFVQTLLPEKAEVRLAFGDDLYRYGGRTYSPKKDTGPAPKCRIEVSPAKPALVDSFLHVLTAADSATATVPKATIRQAGREVIVTVGEARITFAATGRLGGRIAQDGKEAELAGEVHNPAPDSR
jgi:hypothetical protein